MDLAKELDLNNLEFKQVVQDSIVIKDEQEEEQKGEHLITIAHDINRLDDGDWDIISIDDHSL